MLSRTVFVTPALTILALAAVLALSFALKMAPEANALAGADFLSLDADPNTGGANTPTSHGEIQNCVQVAAGGTATVDVVIDSVPAYDGGSQSGGIAGFGMNVLFDQTKLSITARATPLDSTKSLLAVNVSSSVTSFSNGVPQSDGNFKIVELDADASYEGGAGKLYSFTVTVAGGAPSGPTVLDLTDLASDPPSTGNEAGGDGDGIPDLYNADTSLYSIGTVGDATISIGQACGGATPSPSPTPSPTPSPSPPPTPSTGPSSSPTPSPGPSSSPTPTPSPTPLPSPTPTPSPTPSPGPTSTPGPTTQAPTPTTPAPTTPAPTSSQTSTPVPSGSSSPTPSPTATPTLPPGETPTPAPTASPVWGDLDCDGLVTVWDALLNAMLQAGAIVNLPCATDPDVNCSGANDGQDIADLLRFAAGVAAAPEPCNV